MTLLRKLCSALLITFIGLSFVSSSAMAQGGMQVEAKVPWTKALWFIANKIGNYVYQRDPNATYNSNYDTMNMGTHKFNDGDYGASVKHEVDIQGPDDSIVAWAQAVPGNFGRITIIITNPRGDDVVSVARQSNQSVYYDAGKTGVMGTYTVRYAQQNSETWDPWLRLWHWRGSGGRCNEYGCQEPFGSTPVVITEE